MKVDPLVVALERLVAREGGRIKVADEIGVNDQSLYQILRRVPHSVTGKPKGVGPKIRAKLDARYPGWMSLGGESSPPRSGEPPSVEAWRAQLSERPVLIDDSSPDMTFKRVPVVAWDRLGEVLTKRNEELPSGASRVLSVSTETSGKVKWVEVHDDLLAPKVIRGDFVAVDPEGAPRMDSLVLAVAADGTYMLRFWRPLAGGAFEVFDGAGRTMDSIRHGIKVAASFVTLQRDSL